MSRQAVRQRASLERMQPTTAVAMQQDSMRSMILRDAGLDHGRQARLVEQSVSALESSLGAMSILEPERPDWFARIKAAQCLLSLVGAFPSRTVSTSGTPQVTINIDVPDWAQPMMKARQVAVGQNASSGTEPR